MSRHILPFEERRYPAPKCRYHALNNMLRPDGVHPGAAISDPKRPAGGRILPDNVARS